MTDTPHAPGPLLLLGDYVRTTLFDQRGRVYQVHPYGCPHDEAWLAAQQPEVRVHAAGPWVSVLVHGDGAVSAPAALVCRIPAFAFTHPAAGRYFRDPAPVELDPRGCRYLLTEEPGGYLEGADTGEGVVAFIERAILSGDATAVRVELGRHVVEDHVTDP